MAYLFELPMTAVAKKPSEAVRMVLSVPAGSSGAVMASVSTGRFSAAVQPGGRVSAVVPAPLTVTCFNVTLPTVYLSAPLSTEAAPVAVRERAVLVPEWERSKEEGGWAVIVPAVTPLAMRAMESPQSILPMASLVKEKERFPRSMLVVLAKAAEVRELTKGAEVFQGTVPLMVTWV